MELNTFLLKEQIKNIDQGFKQKNGWIKIYESTHFNDENNDESYGIFCSLIKKQFIVNYNSNYQWPVLKGSEGKANIYGGNSYKTYDNEEIEPFLFYKSFSIGNKKVKYIDVSEEFILYFKLYEEITDKQNRKYYFVNDYGELDEVLIIEPNLVKVKLKYLKEYFTIREMYFCISFDFMILLKKINENWQYNYTNELFNEENFHYRHYIGRNSSYYQSWIMGNYFIKPNNEKKSYLDFDKEPIENFIVGINDEGDYIYENPQTASKANFIFSYFKKDVLNKYYNNPIEYEIDGFSLSNRYFRLRLDNNLEDVIPVLLTDLCILPHSEQLHWKQYNIAIEEDLRISPAFYSTMIEGNWHETSNVIDLLFKERYSRFNKKWLEKFGWSLYKPLAKEDEYLLRALHLITENNIKSFCEQTLTIVKITIDRLNEKEISKGIKLESNVRGITKFEKFLESHDLVTPDSFEFLRHLQSLRSGLIAHTFSESNKDCKKAIEYFKIGEKDYNIIFKEILINSLKILNILEKKFLQENVI
ncbi:hypothetical protein CMT72_18055 [Elizabethkingia anophelis]|uniref:hypothetical protein n=1 Tax=Elizabethkingia anophelis TaxID=1117645 RepID=UPI0021A7A98B|nr:hypothetical protein [Elizabethkingia anophelis]MCT4199352.1 hypothetical protein [Elizabethkingia anophelis]MCT4227561.1 hypothetical protein [Elizabethkingia anophelis]MCT4309726.1 hypothetical protein [Elizabethkingia anophelis]MDV3869343.1 hypothetical protein [Elizabethkingia anophelis]